MATLVLTIIGDDRAGLVNAVAGIVSDHGGNWERSQMSELGGKFAGIVLVAVPDSRSAKLIESLAPLDGLLEVTAQAASTTTVPDKHQTFSMDLLGGDRAGIVQEISQVLSEHRVSISSLETETRDAPMAGGRVFAASASLSIPGSTNIDDLRLSLEALANELMVDIDLDPT